MRHQKSHYHPSGSSCSPDIPAGGFDEPNGFETEQILDLPAELHVPSEAPVAKARDERQFDRNDKPGRATWTAEVHLSDPYIPHDPDAGHQGSLNRGQVCLIAVGYPGTRFHEAGGVRFAEPFHGGWSQQFSLLPSSSTAYSDLRQYFPLDNDEHRKKRDALRAVMQSPWKQNNEFEPEASLLLQFMSLDPNKGRWYCTFWKGGKPCDCSCKKRDHAKGHVRSHIDLLPFVCDSRCPYSAAGCAKRYPAVEPLQKHRKGNTMCDHCGLPVLPGNMKRHVQIRHPEM